MKPIWTFLLTMLLLAAPPEHGLCSAAPDKTVLLRQWARENHFAVVAKSANDWIELTNASAEVAFKTNSPLAEVNGVRVWLCEPVVLRGGQPCISSLDLRVTIEPLLAPQRAAFSTTICLDPGHGGKDTGGVCGRLQEKQFTLPLARELAGQLAAAGFKTLLTRTNDTFIELENRPAFANRRRAGLFISLHFNIGAPGEAHGVEVYCLTPARAASTNAKGIVGDARALAGNRQDAQNILLAYQLQKSLVKNLGAEDRGLRRARFEVLRSAQMPAVLIEGGFLSDALEQKKIADSNYRRQLAAAIVQGVLAYQHAVSPHPIAKAA